MQMHASAWYRHQTPTVIYYCHTKHRYDMMDVDFVQSVHAEGLVLEEVFIPGMPVCMHCRMRWCT